MATLNQASLIGFVGDIPKIGTTQYGHKYASLSLATTDKGYTKKDGTTVPDRTEWHNIVLWHSLADIAERFVRKGSSIFVQGKIRTRSYQDKQGQTRYITEIEADNLQLLDRKPDNSTNVQTAQGFSPYAQENDAPF